MKHESTPLERLFQIVQDRKLAGLELVTGSFTLKITAPPPGSEPPAMGGESPSALVEEGVAGIKASSRATLISRRIGFFLDGSTLPAMKKNPLKSGDRIRLGQVIGAVRSLNQVHELKAERTGKVVSLLKKAGDPVQYGEALLEIEEEV